MSDVCSEAWIGANLAISSAAEARWLKGKPDYRTQDLSGIPRGETVSEWSLS